MLRAALLSLGCVLLTVGCAPHMATGRTCERNSECPDPQACVGGRCGSECSLHADCVLGARCVVVAEGVARCFIDSASQCSVDAPCPFEGLSCIEQRCYAPCGADCPSDGACVDGFCVRPSADAGAIDAALP